jgi:para-nitrobenzyl esterase
MEEKDHQLSQLMVDYLMNFVKSGNPNGEGQPQWKRTCPKCKRVMCIGEADAKMDKPNTLKLIKTMLTNKAVGE